MNWSTEQIASQTRLVESWQLVPFFLFSFFSFFFHSFILSFPQFCIISHSFHTYHHSTILLLLDQLIDIDGEDNTTKITRFANYLRIVLPGSDPQVSELAAKALGLTFFSFLFLFSFFLVRVV